MNVASRCGTVRVASILFGAYGVGHHGAALAQRFIIANREILRGLVFDLGISSAPSSTTIEEIHSHIIMASTAPSEPYVAL